jgi:hypothetical protein
MTDGTGIIDGIGIGIILITGIHGDRQLSFEVAGQH